MRIERKGTVKPLTPRVRRFIAEALRGVSLDEVQSPNELRADFICLGGLLVVELKSLEEDGSERFNNLNEELSARDDWPVILGAAPIQSFIKNTNDPEGLMRKAEERIGRGLINPLKKANRQLEAHCVRFPRQNVARALVLVNEDHAVYDPNTVANILMKALNRRRSDGKLLYEHVDFVLYLTERHAEVVDGNITFPAVLIEGQPICEALWKRGCADFIVGRWATWNGVSKRNAELRPDEFQPIDHIPNRGSRQDFWELSYRRNPYLRALSFDQLRERNDAIVVELLLSFIKSTPVKRNREEISRTMELFTHMIAELGERGIPMTMFPWEGERLVAAGRRMHLSDHVLQWLANQGRDRTECIKAK